MKRLKDYLAEDKARTVEEALAALSPPPMVVWRIEGGAHDGRNGGPMLVYAVTRSESELPDPDLALRIAHPQHEWSRIDNVTRAGEIPPAWGTGGAFDHLILFLARQDQTPPISPSPAPEEEK
jgi:hypothetical protein